MHILCLINQKGGVGKSSITFHLAGALADRGLEVLLIDNDPQGSLSQGFFGADAVEQLPLETTLAALFDDSTYFLDDQQLLRPTGQERIHIVPANQLLSPFNMSLPETKGLHQFVLREFLEQVDRFDVALIDCPPNLYLCSWNAMLAAQHILIPVPPEDFGTQGLRTVHQAIEHAQQLNPHLQHMGHFVARSDRRLLIHRAYEQRLRTVYGKTVFDAVIPETTAFKTAVTERLPVTSHSPNSSAANATRQLAAEILENLSNKPGRKAA